jgi:hypothetical protein
MALLHKVVRRLGERLAADELVLHAVPAFHLGGAREIVSAGFRSSGWFVAAAAAGAIDGPDKALPSASVLPLPQHCIVAVTDQRLLIFSSTSFFAHSPVDLLHDIPLARVTWVGEPVPDGRVTKSERVIVGLAGGALLGWEFARLYIAPGQALIADLAQRVSGSLPDVGT